MTRFFVLLFMVVTVFGIGGVLVWTVASRTKETPTSSATSPVTKKFDTTGGQTMRPRWNRDAGEGEAQEREVNATPRN